MVVHLIHVQLLLITFRIQLRLNNKKFATTKSSGFTLIELLVVVAIIGILAAVGVVAYSGYTSAAKKKSTENVMMQIGLAQTEYYSDFGIYYHPSTSCTPSEATSLKVEKDLLEGDGIKRGKISEDLGFEICVYKSGSSYMIKAQDDSTPPCVITVDANNAITRSNC